MIAEMFVIHAVDAPNHVLVKSLDDVKNKWFEIGAFLGVPVSELEIIDDDQDLTMMEDKIKKLIEVRIMTGNYFLSGIIILWPIIMTDLVLKVATFESSKILAISTPHALNLSN